VPANDAARQPARAGTALNPDNFQDQQTGDSRWARRNPPSVCDRVAVLRRLVRPGHGCGDALLLARPGHRHAGSPARPETRRRAHHHRGSIQRGAAQQGTATGRRIDKDGLPNRRCTRSISPIPAIRTSRSWRGPTKAGSARSAGSRRRVQTTSRQSGSPSSGGSGTTWCWLTGPWVATSSPTEQTGQDATYEARDRHQGRITWY
jgi:hypothetical protein